MYPEKYDGKFYVAANTLSNACGSVEIETLRFNRAPNDDPHIGQCGQHLPEQITTRHHRLRPWSSGLAFDHPPTEHRRHLGQKARIAQHIITVGR